MKLKKLNLIFVLVNFRLPANYRYSNGFENDQGRIIGFKLPIEIGIFERCSHDILQFTTIQHQHTIKSKFPSIFKTTFFDQMQIITFRFNSFFFPSCFVCSIHKSNVHVQKNCAQYRKQFANFPPHRYSIKSNFTKSI